MPDIHKGETDGAGSQLRPQPPPLRRLTTARHAAHNGPVEILLDEGVEAGVEMTPVVREQVDTTDALGIRRSIDTIKTGKVARHAVHYKVPVHHNENIKLDHNVPVHHKYLYYCCICTSQC